MYIRRAITCRVAENARLRSWMQLRNSVRRSCDYYSHLKMIKLFIISCDISYPYVFNSETMAVGYSACFTDRCRKLSYLTAFSNVFLFVKNAPPQMHSSRNSISTGIPGKLPRITKTGFKHLLKGIHSKHHHNFPYFSRVNAHHRLSLNFNDLISRYKNNPPLTQFFYVCVILRYAICDEIRDSINISRIEC